VIHVEPEIAAMRRRRIRKSRDFGDGENTR
jgi:hypothetical protein